MERLTRVRIEKPRRVKGVVGILDINYVKRRPPWIVAWWSAALPGLGHIHSGHYLKGLILMSGEILLNNFSNLNLSIFYTMILNFEKARDVINYNWLILYCGIFVFAIWDSYRICIETNKYSLIEESLHSRELDFSTMNTLGVNFLDKRNPHMALMWSFVFSGLYHICNNKLLSGLTLLSWNMVVAYYTKIPEMLRFTLTGQFERISAVIDIQWLLFFPSIFMFSIYDAYTHAIYYNQLYEEEQILHFNKRFGNNKLDIKKLN